MVKLLKVWDLVLPCAWRLDPDLDLRFVNGKFQRCPSLQGIAARDCPGEEQDVINKRLDMSEVERIRTEIGEDRFLDYVNGYWLDGTC
jgi:hypothetical protein